MEVVQSRGHVGLYLELAPGRANLNVLKMAREGLLFDLQASINKARKEGVPVRKENVEVGGNGELKGVNFEVIPLKATSTKERHLLIMFEDATPAGRPESAETMATEVRPGKGGKQKRSNRQTIQLKQELAATKRYLHSLVEDKEASNEELQAANEEILSSNEELQSTNEELQTAKEELESTNEELHTVNEELQNRNLELTQANNDLTNLNASANVPVLMMGSDLRLRNWGPLADKLFNLKASDLGRSIFDINLGVQLPDFKAIINEVVDNTISKEIEAKGPQGRWYMVRMGPYRTADNKIEGVVLAFVDIDRLKQGEAKLRARSEHLEDLVEERSRMLSNATRLAAIGETAGGVGPDFPNPLQKIINTLYLGKEKIK